VILMQRLAFSPDDIHVLRQSIEISEDLISDHFKISTSEWKRYRYDIQSLKDLAEEEITDEAFAQIRRYARCPSERLRGSEGAEYFKICLQDHMIFQALQRDPHIRLLPLSAYIVTHELIHVVRFARFLQRFQVSEREREMEECLVHTLTQELLSPRKIPGLPEVLAAFKSGGLMETLVVAAG
jgi:hypothetical protein